MEKKFLVFSLIFFLYMIPSVSGESIVPTGEPVYIGVLLPLTGITGLPLLDALNYGVDQINSGGGIEGRPVRLICRDTMSGNLQTYAKELALDPRISVVIGPFLSDELFEISDLFIRNQKVLVSPSASSDEIFRAFAGTGNVWRTTTNDRDITSAIMQHLSAHQAQSVALLSPNTTEGKTFYDWIPFWAIETGINLTECIEYSSSDEIASDISKIDESNPDYIIFVDTGSSLDIQTVLTTLKNGNSSSHLYLIQPNVNKYGYIEEKSEALMIDVLLGGLGKVIHTSSISVPLPDDTLLLMSPSPDSDFVDGFTEFSGKESSYFVPEVYDALLVSAEIMCRFNANPSKSPMDAANTILLNENGMITPRTKFGIQSAFKIIQKGNVPVMTGATGLLTFASEGTDRKTPWYQTYLVKDEFVYEDPVFFQSLEKQEHSSDELPVQSSETMGQEKTTSVEGEFWAVIGGLTEDWINYRHQADALTMYQLVKEHGVPDDHIILLVYDDIPFHPRNSKPGEVYHIPDVEEVRNTAIPDYTGSLVNKQTIEDILTGTNTFSKNPVLGSDENATVLVYFASHGAEGGQLILGNGEERISSYELSSIINKMRQNKKFGRMLVILESCFSKATAAEVTTPGVLIMTASEKDETSKSDTYDSDLSNWISDEFSNNLISILRKSDNSLSVSELYKETFREVRSSHPSIVNNNNSFSLHTPVSVFFGESVPE